MKTLLYTALALSFAASFHVHADVQKGYVDGLINVQARKPRLVSNQHGSSFFPGQRLSVKLSGSVDINPTNRWEEECFLAWCKRREWIDHHWFTAAQWPAEFILLDDADTEVAKFTSQGGSAEILIPPNTSAAGFNRRLRLVGMVGEGTPAIDGGRSQGQYTAQIFVDTSERIKQLYKYFAEAKPTAADLKERWVHDPFLIEQNRAAVVRALINLAQTAYPPTNPATRDEHRALLEYAAEIEPTNAAVGTATADMYIQQGNFQGAEVQLVEIIKKLRQTPGAASDPATQTSIARAYLRLATTVAGGRGYADAGDLATIWGHYTAAADIAAKFRAPVLQAEALFGRAHSQRSRNTLDALKAAQDDFRAAREISPQPFPGVPQFTAPAAEEMLILDSPGKMHVASRSMFEASPQKVQIDIGPSFARVWAISSAGKVYVTNEKNLGVLRLTDTSPIFEQMLPAPPDLSSMQTNGRYSILTRGVPPGPPRAAIYGMGPEPKLEMLREPTGGFARLDPILFDGKPPFAATIAAAADRYVVVGPATTAPNTPPVLPLELRDIGPTGDSVVRRFTVNGYLEGPPTISAGGQRVIAIVRPIVAASPTVRQVMVWDDKGAAIEIMTSTVPDLLPPEPGSTAPTIPPDLIRAAALTPDGNTVIVVRADGSILKAPVTQQPGFTKIARTDLNRNFGQVEVSRTLAAGDQGIVIHGHDSQSFFHLFFNAATDALRMVRTRQPSPFTDPVGFWQDAQGRIGGVSPEIAPTKVRSVRISSNEDIAAGTIGATDVFAIKLLKGGRFVCITGGEVGVKDLGSGSYSVVVPDAPPKPPPDSSAVETLGGMPGMPQVEVATCIPQRAADRWLLVRHVGPRIMSATKYVGQQSESAQNAMPAVPADIVAMDSAAAARLKRPTIEPRFMLPAFVNQAFVEADGRMFVAAYPFAAADEAAMKNSTEWVSIPFVMLQDPELAVKRMRLPLGAMALAILPGPRSKVIYAMGGKLLWKPLSTDTSGAPLMDLPPPFGPPALGLAQIAINPEATRIIFGLQLWDEQAVKMVVEQKVFDIGDNDIKLVNCLPCAKRTLNTASLQPRGSMHPFMWGTVLTDAKMENIVIYQNDEHASVYSLASQRQVASLPFRQIAWFSRDRAYFITGLSEYSVINY